MSPAQTSQVVLGFNHNIKHNGRIYHVQTEDSGVQNPHIITHLFVGGNILATKKTSYADIVNADNLREIVRELMEEQHKAMLRNLVNGVYDGIETGATPAMQSHPAPAKLRAAPAKEAETSSPPPQKFPPAGPPATLPSRTQPAIPVHEALTEPAMPVFVPTPKQAPAEDVVRGTKIHSPPPPEEVPPPIPKQPIRPAKPVTILASEPNPALASASTEDASLPPEVEAARRLADRPTPKDTSGPTIFGEDLITEKSLDEVILGYLAGDGEESG